MFKLLTKPPMVMAVVPSLITVKLHQPLSPNTSQRRRKIRKGAS
jgi:hypothetical protein